MHWHCLGNMNTSLNKTCHIPSRRPLSGKGGKIPNTKFKNCIASAVLEVCTECCGCGGGARKIP